MKSKTLRECCQGETVRLITVSSHHFSLGEDTYAVLNGKVGVLMRHGGKGRLTKVSPSKLVVNDDGVTVSEFILGIQYPLWMLERVYC